MILLCPCSAPAQAIAMLVTRARKGISMTLKSQTHSHDLFRHNRALPATGDKKYIVRRIIYGAEGIKLVFFHVQAYLSYYRLRKPEKLKVFMPKQHQFSNDQQQTQ